MNVSADTSIPKRHLVITPDDARIEIFAARRRAKGDAQVLGTATCG